MSAKNIFTSLLLSGAMALSVTGSVMAKSKWKRKKRRPVQRRCDVMLKQKDFNDGTYIIRQPGKYCLAENISFNPNSAAYLRRKTGDLSITAYEASMPLRSQLGFGPGQYDPSAFSLGFFAAIAVAAPNVTLDLRGKRIEQSKEHALLQRFFAVIETADRPFISGQGPSDFGTIVGAAENLVIKNGTIGRAAHHGIHGNRSKNVTVENVRFVDFEVAAISMNGVDGLKLKNLRARSRRDVPVLGQYSTAQFIKQYVDFLVLSRSETTINGLSAVQVQSALKNAINNVHEDLITRKRRTISKRRHPAEWKLFHNKFGIVDGNAYGFLINGVGVAVGGFPLTTSTDSPSNRVSMENVHVDFLKANIREIVSIAADGNTAAHVKDPIGSVFQILAKDPNGRPLAMTRADKHGVYLGNVVTNAQALVAKATHNGEFPSFLDTSRNSITPAVIDWVESGNKLKTYLAQAPGPQGTGFICNGDQMFHVNKGVIGFKLDGSKNISLNKVSSSLVQNIGKAGTKLCGDYDISIGAATLFGYGGAITRAMSISGSQNVLIRNFRARNTLSSNGSAVGIDIQTDSSNVAVKKAKVIRTIGSLRRQTAPTASPEAIGVRVSEDAQNVLLFKACSKRLRAYRNQTEKIQDSSNSALIFGRCR